MNDKDKLNEQLATTCYSVFIGSFMNLEKLQEAEKRIKLLIDQGSDPNIPYTDQFNKTKHPIILDYCAVKPVLEILLKNGGNPKFSDEHGNTLSHYIVGIGVS